MDTYIAKHISSTGDESIYIFHTDDIETTTDFLDRKWGKVFLYKKSKESVICEPFNF